MRLRVIKTRKFMPPKDNLWDLLKAIKTLKENSVVAVTSKVVSISEGRCIKIKKKINKDELIKKEADKYIPRELAPNKWIMHTIKNNLLVASAGIDESNGRGYYILWPKNPNKSARKIWQFLRERFNLKKLGVIITDSRLIPLRRGVVGVAISYFGFKPLKDYRGKIDIFGREMVMETSNIPESLATAAVLEMGEGAEQSPIAIIEDVPYIEFVSRMWKSSKPYSSFEIPEEEDVFSPFLSNVKWRKGEGGKKGNRE